MVGLLVTIGSVVAVSTAPASALTSNQKFILAVHQDFLLRGVSSDEMTWWTAYLAGGGTRSAMLASLFDDDHFKGLWVFGASLYYLDDDTDDDTFLDVVDDLIASDDFTAAEVAVIAGPRYYANHGGTNSDYVQGVYEDVLLRTPSSGDLSYWSGRLDAGTSTRSSLANYFIRTSEGAMKRVAGVPGMTSCTATTLETSGSLTAGSYCIVLDRLADSTGATYWAGQLAGSGQLPTHWRALAATSEYLALAQTRF
jgi:hypothetical protein